ncbi:MAG TPA: zinc ribbon domain-containing protein [Gemmatimonadales bacterium]|nr:zinc ribbon domain-containing protein [Gemmatimonadales bacterium]
MPTYEFKCPKGHVFDKFFPTMTNRRTATCPKCGKRAVRQISGGAGLVFKGSGFYITDYKRAGEKHPPEGDSKPKESKPSDQKSSETKSPSKGTPSSDK